MKELNQTELYASTEMLRQLLAKKRAWLYDGDNTAWLSEPFAFEALCAVVNDYLSEFGLPPQFGPSELMEHYRGLNARAIFTKVAEDFRVPLSNEKLEALVAEELAAAIDVLSQKCEVAPGLTEVLVGLEMTQHLLVLVSSSAMERLKVCLDRTELNRFILHVYSAVDSLPLPKSKPAPDIYRFALAELGLKAHDCVAFEDSVSGVESAVEAGLDVVGYVGLAPQEEQDGLALALLDAGAKMVLKNWHELLPVIDTFYERL
jgi:beta-phosphoglucomutase-like phosphatase (HAD superfamily)